jgi:hypothetical protein
MLFCIVIIVKLVVIVDYFGVLEVPMDAIDHPECLLLSIIIQSAVC